MMLREWQYHIRKEVRPIISEGGTYDFLEIKISCYGVGQMISGKSISDKRGNGLAI